MYIIYLITNKVNGKVYVGQTGQTLKKRWSGHLQDFRKGADQPLYRAIRKYGIENFSIEPILTVPTKEEADHQERLWIILLGAHVSQHGYVCTWAGDGRNGVSWETKKKRTESIRKSLQINPSLHPKYREDVRDEDITRMYVKEGLSKKQISEKLNFSRPALTVRFRKLGIKVGQGRHEKGWVNPNPNFLANLSLKGIDSPNHRQELSTDDMSELYGDGFSLRQIGKKLGCAASVVRYRLIGIGMKLRPSNKISRTEAA